MKRPRYPKPSERVIRWALAVLENEVSPRTIPREELVALLAFLKARLP